MDVVIEVFQEQQRATTTNPNKYVLTLKATGYEPEINQYLKMIQAIGQPVKKDGE